MAFRDSWLAPFGGQQHNHAAPRADGGQVRLAEQLGLPIPELSRTYNLDDLSAQPGWPDVLMMEGFEALPPSSQERWLSLLVRWSHASQKAISEGRALPALCCVAKPRSEASFPALSEVCLKVDWWWGLPSALECQMLCRIQENDGGAQGARNAWRESLIPSLAAGDVELFAELWPQIASSRTDLREILCSFGRTRGWRPDQLQEALYSCNFDHLLGRRPANGPQCDTRTGPPDGLRASWLEGLIQVTPEHGCELHTAALAVLGQWEVVDHRLWRAEAALILPTLDARRHGICRTLTDRYGFDWPLQWQQPQSEEEYSALQDSPFACQWGHLEALLRHCSALRRERGLLTFVSHCRYVRNELAHCRLVEFADFERVWNGVTS